MSLSDNIPNTNLSSSNYLVFMSYSVTQEYRRRIGTFGQGVVIDGPDLKINTACQKRAW